MDNIEFNKLVSDLGNGVISKDVFLEKYQSGGDIIEKQNSFNAKLEQLKQQQQQQRMQEYINAVNALSELPINQNGGFISRIPFTRANIGRRMDRLNTKIDNARNNYNNSFEDYSNAWSNGNSTNQELGLLQGRKIRDERKLNRLQNRFNRLEGSLNNSYNPIYNNQSIQQQNASRIGNNGYGNAPYKRLSFGIPGFYFDRQVGYNPLTTQQSMQTNPYPNSDELKNVFAELFKNYNQSNPASVTPENTQQGPSVSGTNPVQTETSPDISTVGSEPVPEKTSNQPISSNVPAVENRLQGNIGSANNISQQIAPAIPLSNQFEIPSDFSGIEQFYRDNIQNIQDKIREEKRLKDSQNDLVTNNNTKSRISDPQYNNRKERYPKEREINYKGWSRRPSRIVSNFDSPLSRISYTPLGSGFDFVPPVFNNPAPGSFEYEINEMRKNREAEDAYRRSQQEAYNEAFNEYLDNDPFLLNFQ